MNAFRRRRSARRCLPVVLTTMYDLPECADGTLLSPDGLPVRAESWGRFDVRIDGGGAPRGLIAVPDEWRSLVLRPELDTRRFRAVVVTRRHSMQARPFFFWLPFRRPLHGDVAPVGEGQVAWANTLALNVPR